MGYDTFERVSLRKCYFVEKLDSTENAQLVL